VPRRLDPWVTGRLTSLYLRLNRRKAMELAEEMHQALVSCNGIQPRRLVEEHFRALIESRWGQMKSVFGSWEPATTVAGLENLAQALTQGRGAILWGMNVGDALAVKIGMRRAGFPIVHLSNEIHGLTSRSNLAVKVVGPLRRGVEDRYHRERVVIPSDGSLGYLRTLGERLEANAVVSISGEYPSRQSIEAPVFQCPTRFGLGAPSLAYKHRSALLTVYAVREAPGRYRVVIEEPISVDRGGTRKQFAEAAIREFAARLERVVARHPSDWENWPGGRLKEPNL
jgi:lauroyl/myristoyl acyltransferase